MTSSTSHTYSAHELLPGGRIARLVAEQAVLHPKSPPASRYPKDAGGGGGKQVAFNEPYNDNAAAAAQVLPALPLAEDAPEAGVIHAQQLPIPIVGQPVNIPPAACNVTLINTFPIVNRVLEETVIDCYYPLVTC